MGRMYPPGYGATPSVDPEALSFSSPLSGGASAGDIIITDAEQRFLLADGPAHGVRGGQSHHMFTAHMLTHQVGVYRVTTEEHPVAKQGARAGKSQVGTYWMAFRISEERLDRTPDMSIQYERYKFLTAEAVQEKDELVFDGKSVRADRVVYYNGIYLVEAS